jgi:hypothetical protein
MKLYARGLAVALFFLLGAGSAFAIGAGSAFAQAALGSITYLDGDVTIVRDGAEIDSVAIGQDIQNFDLVKTGADGQVEIAFTSADAPHLTVKVAADTQFSIEIASLNNGKQQTSVGILGGSLSLKVAKLLGTQELRVRTDSAAMGVRGTEFTVTAPITGDVLVTCDEGEVVCTDDQGKDLSAIPGTVVEKQPGELYRTVPVAADGLAQFRTQWSADRDQALQRNALRIIQANARFYLRLSREIDAADAELQKSRSILQTWSEEDRRGRVQMRASLARERRTVGVLLARMRTTQFQLERVSYRLERLRRLSERGIGVGSIDGGVATAAFFAQVQNERAELQRKLAETRHVAKMYARRSEGRLP